MLILTSQEIALYRSELAANFTALKALDEIENCEGSIEDAAISLALREGQEPSNSEAWLDSLAKRCRSVVCELDSRSALAEGRLAPALNHLLEAHLCPEILAPIVIIYILKTGINNFCRSLVEA